MSEQCSSANQNVSMSLDRARAHDDVVSLIFHLDLLTLQRPEVGVFGSLFCNTSHPKLVLSENVDENQFQLRITIALCTCSSSQIKSRFDCHISSRSDNLKIEKIFFPLCTNFEHPFFMAIQHREAAPCEHH